MRRSARIIKTNFKWRGGGETAFWCSCAFKCRTIPDRIHTTVPSAFEFPTSRKTLHELESSSIEVMIGMGGTDWMTISNVNLWKFWKETIPWSLSLTVFMESAWRNTGSLLKNAKIMTATWALVVKRWEECAPSSVEERQGGWESWTFSVVGIVEGTCEEPLPCWGY